MIRNLDQISEFRLQEILHSLEWLEGDYDAEKTAIRSRLEEFSEERKRVREEYQRQLAAEAEKRRVAMEEERKRQESDPQFVAAAAGWDAMKALVPNLDGVGSFAELPDALLFRYAAFARGVLGVPQPRGYVLSQNQLVGRTEVPDEVRVL
ncbi:hypothetical protein ACH47B_13045 [Rhodococcus sp. NPDC019627]|uniref:hypothetical protein n=1 Tax=unclassified Rhodococcus (in: high G+C Gram-positive bacteria) TaxID=192944 RepID=UPI003407B8CC